MKKNLILLCLALWGAFLLAPPALGADSNAVPSIEAADLSLQDGKLSFTLNLTGPEKPEEGDSVFVAVYAPSGRMEQFTACSAAPSVPVTLDGVAETSSVQAVWVRRECAPAAAVRVMGTSSFSARSYEEYAAQLSRLLVDFSQFSARTVSASTDKYAFARLIVHAKRELPDYIREGLARRVSDAEGNTVLQFTSPQAAKTCAENLQTWISTADGEYVESDTLMRAIPTENAEGAAAKSALSWGVSVIRADAYAADLARRGVGKTVTVAVVDSGVDSSHPFLARRLAAGHDYVDDDDNPNDEFFHGTHVTGTVVDCTPGLANIKVMPVRVLDSTGNGSSLAVGMGIRYAADHGADVINLSLGGAHSLSIDNAVTYALSKNVIVVSAAGNDKGPTRNYCPAHIDGCITVSAVDSGLHPASFSNHNPGLDLAAPGVSVNSIAPGGGYRTLSGTSMSAPHVAACAAMLRAEFPSLTPAQAAEELVNAVQKPEGWDEQYGPGVLDMKPFVRETPCAVLYKDGELVFQIGSAAEPGREVEQSYPLKTAGTVAPDYTKWYAEREKIKKVTFKDQIRPDSTALWFSGCTALTSVQGLDKLDLSHVTDMSQMFSGCSALVSLDLSGLDTGHIQDMSKLFFHCASLQTLNLRGWNTAAVTSMEDMFKDCGKLKTISVSDGFTTAAVKDGDTMFENCAALCGSMGTAYSVQHTDRTYARIDGGAALPGYFHPPGPSETLYAVLYDDGELSFQGDLTPQAGRTARKTYQTDGGGYDDGAYTAWYKEREQILSVSFETDIYPVSTALWFYGCKNLAGFKNMQRLHTDHVTDMSQMFSYCASLKELDLRGFATAKTANTNTMFFRCTALAAIRVSAAFATDQITDSKSMFEGCTALTGSAGTPYDSAHTDKVYARIDGGPNAPGYF